MYKLYEKDELWFAVLWIIGYVVLFSVADSISNDLGIMKLLTAPLSLTLALILYLWIRKYGLLEKYGICSFKGKLSDYLYFIPLFVIMSVNLWYGVSMNATSIETVLYIISMFCVGFLEEVIFRGLLFKAISKDSMKQAIIFSSLSFGMGHIVNLLNGAEFFPTLLQICYASAIGLLFTIIFYKSGSLYPCILTHSIFNSLSIFGKEGSPIFHMGISAILCVISVAYALWIWRNVEKDERIKTA